MHGGTIATGDNIIVANVYHGPSARNPGEALAIYQRVLTEGFRHLSLRGLDVGASDPTGAQQRFELAQLYVEMLTTTQVPLHKRSRQRSEQRELLREERETRPLSALEAVIAYRQVVLLGDPGSGKSTFLSHLALCLAAQGLEPQQKWLERLPGWKSQEADLVPVLVTLRDFARWLPDKLPKAEPQHLWKFLIERLERQNLAFVADPLHDQLEGGKVILLLDGLDEIPTQQKRTFIRDAVAAFANRYPRCRIVVTCRTLSYQDPKWRLVSFESFTLAPFSEEQIDQFITAWYSELVRLGNVKPDALEDLAWRLRTAVRRPDLWRLAANPLLLTAMALVHTHKGRLPDARALLYEETVDILLWRWEQLKLSEEDDTPHLRALLSQVGRTDVDLKRALWQLAFAAHQQGGNFNVGFRVVVLPNSEL
jgi:predicted NACHT family NTPase